MRTYKNIKLKFDCTIELEIKQANKKHLQTVLDNLSEIIGNIKEHICEEAHVCSVAYNSEDSAHDIEDIEDWSDIDCPQFAMIDYATVSDASNIEIIANNQKLDCKQMKLKHNAIEEQLYWQHQKALHTIKDLIILANNHQAIKKSLAEMADGLSGFILGTYKAEEAVNKF